MDNTSKVKNLDKHRKSSTKVDDYEADEILSSQNYIAYCKSIVQKSSKSQQTVQLTKNYGYIVKNFETKVDMTPPISSNIQDMMEYEG
jgi:hypothetical protein